MDKVSYESFLDEYGLTQEQVTSMVEFEGDQIELPKDITNVYKAESTIHGMGLFVADAVPAGEIIAPARINGMRTAAGRWINHSANPNSEFIKDPNSDDLYVVSLRDLSANEEITICYRKAMSVNGAGFTPRFDFPQIIKDFGFDIAEYTNRQKIEVIEWIIKNKIENIIDQLEVRHTIHGGLYAREMTIPAGVILTGKIHNFDHINIMSKGDISIMTDDGMKRIKAPFTGMSRAGLKRIGYAHEETVWTTIHAIEETDLEKIEQILFNDGDISWVDNLQGLICQQV